MIVNLNNYRNKDHHKTSNIDNDKKQNKSVSGNKCPSNISFVHSRNSLALTKAIQLAKKSSW